MKSFLIASVLCIAFLFCDAEMFSAIESLEKLFEDEKKLLESFHNVVETSNNTRYKEKLEKWKSENEKAQENFIEYIGNPLNAFLLIKRMAMDYKQMQSQLGIEIGYFQPDESDLRGAVEGLLRLQPFYKQQSSEFAKGFIDGVKTRDELTAHDLYVIGSEARLIPEHEYFAKEYLSLAWEKLNKEGVFDEVNRLNLLLEIVELLERTFDYRNAVAVMDIIIQHFNSHETVVKKRDDLSKLFEEFGDTKLKQKTPFVDSFTKYGYYTVENEMIYFGQVCRGEVEKSPKEKAELHCRYVSNSPFSKLAPFKVEEANLDPYIVVYIDVLSDNEIEVVKNITKPNINRAQVSDDAGTQTKVSNQARVAQVAWFFDEDHEVVRRISRRVEVS